MTQDQKTSDVNLEVPIMGHLRIVENREKGTYYAQFVLADGSHIIIRAGKDGFFDENYNEARKYAVQMKRLIDFLAERDRKKEQDNGS